jgi:hypothetical protein
MTHRLPRYMKVYCVVKSQKLDLCQFTGMYNLCGKDRNIRERINVANA